MFASDKDLRKAPSKKSATRSSGTAKAQGSKSTGESVVERAKREREERANDREMTKACGKIQSWWRGRWVSFTWREAQRNDFDKKMGDLEKISQLLFKTKNITLVPPLSTSLELTKKVLSGKFIPQDGQRIVKLCQHVLAVSLGDLDATKNICTILYHQPFLCKKIIDRIFMAINYSMNRLAAVRESDIENYVVPCLPLVLGLKAPYRMRYCHEIDEAFEGLRRLLLDTNSTSTNLISRVSLVLIKRSHKMHMDNIIDENDTSKGVISSTKFTRQPEGCVADQLVSMCITAMAHDGTDGALYKSRSGRVCREILAVPMLTGMLSTKCMSLILATSSMVELVVRTFSNVSQLALPSSPFPVFKSGQWLLGNLTSLGPFLAILPRSTSEVSAAKEDKKSSGEDPSQELLSDALLIGYFDLVVSLLTRFDVPGVWTGKCSVIWAREGAVLQASAVPKALQIQLLSLIDSIFLKALYARCVRPFPLPLGSDILESKQSSRNIPRYMQPLLPWDKDCAEVREALSSTGLKMARDTLQEQRDSSSLLGGGSKWASKIMSGLRGVFGGGSSAPSTQEAYDAARLSRVDSNADSKASAGDNETPSMFPPCEESVMALCRLWSLLFPHAAHAPHDSAVWRGLSSLAFSTRALGRLWAISVHAVSKKHSSSTTALSTTLSFGSAGGEFSPENDLSPGLAGGISVLVNVAAIFRIACIALDDAELYDKELPLPLVHVLPLVRAVNSITFQCISENPALMLTDVAAAIGGAGSRAGSGNASSSDPLRAQANSERDFALAYRVSCIRCFVAILSDLHTRWARRPFSFPKLWEVPRANTSVFINELRQFSPLGRAVLKYQPWAVNFHQRMQLFRDVMKIERQQIQGSNDINSGQRSRGTIVRVRRQRILADGMDALARVGSAIKDRIVVRYVNDFGEDEAGIDVGGLFKDFWTDLSGRVFNPSFGLFAMTSGQLLYPNPNAGALYDTEELDSTFEFLGRILGKALFENLTVQPQFAHFFLAFMMGRYNFTGLVNDLQSLDPDLFKNLMFLKTYEGDIADLCLSFSISDDAYGSHKEIELFPGGSSVEVTSANRHRYINLAAKYYLHDRICRQARYFFTGLYTVVSPDLLGMFCAPELQVLISGAASEISIEELKSNTRYAAGYSIVDRNISRFWAVVGAFNDADRALLIKFVTSCERPPSLGFGDLNPPFTIQRVDCNDDSRLPTASTCFNILKLPTYSSQNVLRDKLLTAIRSNSGFDLS